jgi:hypothetical protein
MNDNVLYHSLSWAGKDCQENPDLSESGTILRASAPHGSTSTRRLHPRHLVEFQNLGLDASENQLEPLSIDDIADITEVAENVAESCRVKLSRSGYLQTVILVLCL